MQSEDEAIHPSGQSFRYTADIQVLMEGSAAGFAVLPLVQKASIETSTERKWPEVQVHLCTFGVGIRLELHLQMYSIF